jgi:hypothetical protein
LWAQQRVEISEFAGLKSTSGCITYGRQVRENSLGLFDALASQVIAKVSQYWFVISIHSSELTSPEPIPIFVHYF